MGTNAAWVTATRSAPLASATSYTISTITFPANNLHPNLSAWTFQAGPFNPPLSATPVTTNDTVFPTFFPITSNAPTASPVNPVSAGGTEQRSSADYFPGCSNSNSNCIPPFINAPQSATNSFTV